MAAADDLRALGYVVDDTTVTDPPTWLIDGYGRHWQVPANHPDTVTALTALAQDSAAAPVRQANEQTLHARAADAIDQLSQLDDQLTALDQGWATMTNAAKLDVGRQLALGLRQNERATRAVLRLLLRRFESAA